MNYVPVTITHIVRAMRGGSQARLVLGDDGRAYVAKFAGNPQGTRTLINEWVVYQLLKQLDVCTPDLHVLHLPQSLQSEDLCFSVGAQRIPVQGGLHLGSQCPVDPAKTAIFDFLPNRLLAKVSNLPEFGAMFVFDRWVHQTDKRQSILVRDRSLTSEVAFVAYFIDHGMCFAGSQWDLGDAPFQGLAFQRSIYSLIDMQTLVEEALCRLEGITEGTLLATMDGVPSAWFAQGDHESMSRLLDKLQQRQAQMRSIVLRHLRALELHVALSAGLSTSV